MERPSETSMRRKMRAALSLVSVAVGGSGGLGLGLAALAAARVAIVGAEETWGLAVGLALLAGRAGCDAEPAGAW